MVSVLNWFDNNIIMKILVNQIETKTSLLVISNKNALISGIIRQMIKQNDKECEFLHTRGIHWHSVLWASRVFWFLSGNQHPPQGRINCSFLNEVHEFIPIFSGFPVVQSLGFSVVFCLSFCSFSSGHCIVYPSNYGFSVLLWYLHTFLW